MSCVGADATKEALACVSDNTGTSKIQRTGPTYWDTERDITKPLEKEQI